MQYIVIDTETTGLKDGDDEVLSLAIVDENGNKLFYELFKPQRKTEWPEAERINNIHPSDVADKRPITDYADELDKYFDGSYAIAGYNTYFDIKMLRGSGRKIAHVQIIDVMREFNALVGGYNKLVDCADYFGYTFHAHDALNDAMATAYCYKRIQQTDSAPQTQTASTTLTQPKKKMNGGTIAIIVFAVLFIISAPNGFMNYSFATGITSLIIGLLLGFWAYKRMH